jgi:hypothetical protein
MKRSVIKRRKRIVVSEQGEEQEIEEESSDEEVQLKNKRKKVIKSTLVSVPSSSSPVPPIEDYIEPKRSPLRSLPSSPPSSTSHPHARLPPPPRTPPPFNRTLPSIPDIRNHPRFDPIFDYRSTPQKNLPANSRGYEDLIEFDDAMTRLERIRRRVPSEQHRTLSSLTNALQKIVIEAENILYNK